METTPFPPCCVSFKYIATISKMETVGNECRLQKQLFGKAEQLHRMGSLNARAFLKKLVTHVLIMRKTSNGLGGDPVWA